MKVKETFDADDQSGDWVLDEDADGVEENADSKDDEFEFHLRANAFAMENEDADLDADEDFDFSGNFDFDESGAGYDDEFPSDGFSSIDRSVGIDEAWPRQSGWQNQPDFDGYSTQGPEWGEDDNW